VVFLTLREDTAEAEPIIEGSFLKYFSLSTRCLFNPEIKYQLNNMKKQCHLQQRFFLNRIFFLQKSRFL